MQSSRGSADDDDDGGEGPTPSLLPLLHPNRPSPWQSESLLASSWSTISDIDLGDNQNQGTHGAHENHSSSSEPETLEQEEVEVEDFWAESVQRKGEGQATEHSEFKGATDEDIQAPQTQELLVSVEEPHTDTESTEFMQVVPPMALPPLPILKLDPPSNIPTPDLSTDTEDLPSTLGLHPPPILGPVNAPTFNTAAELSSARDHSESKGAKNETSSEIPVLLCGSAALITVIGVMTYAAVALHRK